MTINSKKRFRLHGAAVALALIVGWLSAPLSLIAWEPDVCEMECCIAEGHCCCATHHAYVKGREPKPGPVTMTRETGLIAPCPAGRTGATTTARNCLPQATPAVSPLIEITTITFSLHRHRVPLDCSFQAQPSSPRAPPSREAAFS
ncbi:MAG TPA: hypothetical protein VJ302_33750 [Blastocatellia bacterium]|nr:hypothetical protein [Blastocatellia bacterium]